MSSSPPFFNTVGGSTYTTPFNSQQSQKTSSSQSLSPSILTLILILSITIIVSTSLCIIIRYLRSRFLHRDPSSSDELDEATSNGVVSNRDRRLSSRRVLPDNDEPLIQSLPLFTFKSLSSGRSGSLTGGDCAVCLSKFEPNDQLRLLPICCHAFHAECVDTWLKSNQTCPLCRSPIYATDSEILSKVIASSAAGNQSFRIEIGNVSRRQDVTNSREHRRSYSIGSFDYIVEDESQVSVLSTRHARGFSDATFSDKDDSISIASKSPGPSLAGEVGSGRSRLREYMDMLSERVSLSSRALSFRGSGRFFTGSSRRSVLEGTGSFDVEANHVGEEISEFFRWFSGV